MSTPAPSLTTLEVAVRGGGTALAETEDIVVHAQTHGAAGITPFESGIDEDPIEALSFSRLFDLLRARHNQRAHAVGHAPPTGYVCSLTQIIEPGIGARSHEHAVDRNPF